MARRAGDGVAGRAGDGALVVINDKVVAGVSAVNDGRGNRDRLDRLDMFALRCLARVFLDP